MIARLDVRGHDRIACFPPMAEALASVTEAHQAASRALREAGMPVLDPERLWHSDLARDALVLRRRLQPDVLDEDDGDIVQERPAGPTTAILDRALAERGRAVSTQAATLTALPPCASCDPTRCDHALTWWCADCDRREDCGNRCAGDAFPGAAEERR